jgi:hypothetical protein
MLIIGFIGMVVFGFMVLLLSILEVGRVLYNERLWAAVGALGMFSIALLLGGGFSYVWEHFAVCRV